MPNSKEAMKTVAVNRDDVVILAGLLPELAVFLLSITPSQMRASSFGTDDAIMGAAKLAEMAISLQQALNA